MSRLSYLVALSIPLVMVHPAAEARTLGVIADDDSKSVTVFDADSDILLGNIALPASSGTTGDCVISRDNRYAYVTNDSNGVHVIDLNNLTLASGTNPIPMSNLAGHDIALGANGRYLIVSNGSTSNPLSVLDTVTRAETDALNLTDLSGNSIDAVSVAVCDDGSVLATSFFDNSLHRLTLNGSGQLTDTGVSLSISGPLNVNCAPGGQSGVVTSYDYRLQSFTVPNLAPVTQLFTTYSGMSGAFNPKGDDFYARSKQYNGNPGEVNEYSFDATTGVMTTIPELTVPVNSGAAIFFGIDQLAMHPDGNKFYVSAAADGVRIHDSENGTLLGNLSSANLTFPTGICLSPKVNLNNEFSISILGRTGSRTPVSNPAGEGPKGQFQLKTKFCNSGTKTLIQLQSVTTVLTNGNCLINRTAPLPAMLATCGVGSKLDIPPTGDYADGQLSPGECVNLDYELGLAKYKRFYFHVDILGQSMATAGGAP